MIVWQGECNNNMSFGGHEDDGVCDITKYTIGRGRECAYGNS